MCRRNWKLFTYVEADMGFHCPELSLVGKQVSYLVVF